MAELMGVGSMQPLEHLQGTLNTAEAGCALAERVLIELRRAVPVVLDFRHVRRITPSFANALVMRVLASDSAAIVLHRLEFLDAQSHVLEQLEQAADRFARGIRLSDQRVPVPA